MSKIITVNDINSTKFYQLPKAFFHNPLYMDMRNESKLAYSILRDLLELSIKNKWINENNEVYVKLSREKIMNYLHVKGKQKITEVMAELKNKELIVERQIGVNKCNEIYICIPDELDVIYSDKELLETENDSLETVENTLKFENQTSRSSKIKLQEVRKSNSKKFENQTHTKTNYTKTNYTNDDDDSTQNIIDLYTSTFKKTETTEKSLKELINTYSVDLVIKVINRMIELQNDDLEIKVPIRYLKNSLENELKPKKDKKTRSKKIYANKSNELKFNNFDPREKSDRYVYLEEQCLLGHATEAERSEFDKMRGEND